MHYDRYINRGQKVYLINIADTRDTSVYESMSGTVVSCDEQRITLKAPYRLFSGESSPFVPGSMLKLTTEAFGMGIQMYAELLGMPAAETITIRPTGALESYQRRSAPRADATLPFLHVPQKSSLQAFQREWRRVVTDLHKPLPPHLKLGSTALNLSVGGISFETAAALTPLSILVLDLQDQRPCVCVVAELIWQRQNEERTLVRCGHRFVEILKEDQERLATFVEKVTGVRTLVMKSRELMDSPP